MQRIPYYSALLLGLSAAGCSQAVMRTPSYAEPSRELKIEGYSGSFKFFKEKDIKIGGYTVTNIDRDWDKTKKAQVGGVVAKETKDKAYRFDVKGRDRTLHAECTEHYQERSVGGFGKFKVSFACTCTEGNTARVQVSLENEAGSVQVTGGPTYQLTSVHESEQGSRLYSAIGYELKGEQTAGAVDVGAKGRAWLPATSSDEEVHSIVCSYASLLLYRPSE